MTRPALGCLLALTATILMGCYRPARMDMTPLIQPWRAPQSASNATSPAPRARWKAPTVQALSPKQLVHHLLRSNLRLRQLRRQFALQLANAKGFDSVENPEIRVMGLSAALANGNVDQLGVRLRWSPPFPTIHAATVDRNKALAMAEGQRLWLETYELLAKARKYYVEAIQLKRMEALSAAQIKLQTKQWRWEQTRRKAGITTTLSVATQRMAVVQRQLQRQQLTQRRQQLVQKLQVLLGVQGSCRPAPPTDFDKAMARRPSQRDAIVQALERAPGLAIIRYRYRAHKAALWIETTKRIPWFSFFQLSYEFGQSSWPYGFFLGMGVQVPLFNWNTARIEQQRRSIKALKAQARLQVSQIVHRLIASHKRWRQARRQLDKARLLLTRHIKQSKALLRKTPSAGVPPLQRWQLRGSILQLQTQLSQLSMRFRMATIALDRDSYAAIWKRFGVTPPK